MKLTYFYTILSNISVISYQHLYRPEVGELKSYFFPNSRINNYTDTTLDIIITIASAVLIENLQTSYGSSVALPASANFMWCFTTGFNIGDINHQQTRIHSH